MKDHKNDYKYMKDFSKCGLTCPQNLLKILIQCLNEAFDFNLPENFYSVILETDDGSYDTKRGYILGMANNAMTLIQEIIFRMNPCLNNGWIIGNDDSAVFCDQ